MKLSLGITVFTLCWLAMAAELIKKPAAKSEKPVVAKKEKSAIKTKKISFKDLAPNKNSVNKRIPRRAPAAVYYPYQKEPAMYLYGACRDSFGRYYGPRDKDYQYCLDDFPPLNGQGPFGKRKYLGIGIFFND